MGKVKTSFHEHLRTGSYNGSFDSAVELAAGRLGPGGIFSVVSTGDDRLRTDRRYERFADSAKKSKYSVRDLDGKGLYVEDLDIGIFSGIEVEMGNKHLVVLGLERDTVVLPGSSTPLSETMPEEVLNYLEDKNVLTIAAHPFYGKDGFGDYLANSLVRCEDEWLKQLTGFEVYNNQMNFPFSEKTKGANTLAMHLAQDLEGKFLHLAHIYSEDGHSGYEFGRVTTKIEDPGLRAVFSGDTAIDRTRASFERLTLEESIKDNHPMSQFVRTIGALGTLHHVLDLTFIHPGRLRREAKCEARLKKELESI